METLGFSASFVSESLDGYEAGNYEWLSFIEKYNFRLLPFTPESIGSVEKIFSEFNFDSIVSIDCNIFNDFTGNSLTPINPYDLKITIDDYRLFSMVVFSSIDPRALLIYDKLGIYILLVDNTLTGPSIINNYNIEDMFLSYLKDDDYYGKYDTDLIVAMFDKLRPYLNISHE